MNKVKSVEEIIAEAKKTGNKDLLNQLAGLGLYQPPIEENIKYVCTHCEHSFESKKVRKGCPKCRKRKLKEYTVEVDVSVANTNRPNMEDFVTTTKKKGNKRARINPETGKQEGTYTIGETVQAETKFFNKGAKEKLDSLVKPPEELAERRSSVKKVSFYCDPDDGGCGQTLLVHPIHAKNYLCNNCATKSRRRRRG